MRPRRTRATPARSALEGPEGALAVCAPLQGIVVSLDVAEGDIVRPGQQIAVIEAMKMEHLVAAPGGGDRAARRGRARATRSTRTTRSSSSNPPTSAPRPLRKSGGRPRGRPARPRRDAGAAGFRLRREPPRGRRQTAKDQPSHRARERRGSGDPGSFLEYGSLAVAAQAARRSRDDLIRNTPGRRRRRRPRDRERRPLRS